MDSKYYVCAHILCTNYYYSGVAEGTPGSCTLYVTPKRTFKFNVKSEDILSAVDKSLDMRFEPVWLTQKKGKATVCVLYS